MRNPEALLRRLNPPGSPKFSLRIPRGWSSEERRACCLSALGHCLVWACQGCLGEGRACLDLAEKLAGPDLLLERECFSRRLSLWGLEGKWTTVITEIRKRLPQANRAWRDHLELSLSQALRANGQLEDSIQVLRGYRNRARRRGDRGLADYLSLFLAADQVRLGQRGRAERILRKVGETIYPPAWAVEIELYWIRQGINTALPARSFLHILRRLPGDALLDLLSRPDDESRPVHSVALLPARLCLVYTRLARLGARVSEADLPSLLPLTLLLFERVRAQVGYTYGRAEILRGLGLGRASQEEYWRALQAAEWLDGRQLSARAAFVAGFRWLGSSAYELLPWTQQKRQVDFEPPRLTLEVLREPGLRDDGGRLDAWIAHPMQFGFM